MWDIPAALKGLFEIIHDVFKATSADESSKRLENEKAKDEYEAKKDRLAFSARMRRYLSGLKMFIVFIFTLMLIVSCAHQIPLTNDERKQFEDCKEQNEKLREYLNDCLDRVDRCDYQAWFELGCF